MGPIRVLLADDHALVRAGIKALIGRIEGVDVVGEASHGREALQMIETLRPDILLLDISMPSMSGFELLDICQKRFKDVRVIILSLHDDPAIVTRALRSGAAGYLPKTAPSNELQKAIEAVARGETYVMEESARLPTDQEPTAPELTPRQREILTLIAEGYSTKNIARKLDISVKTVESHRAKLAERLNIHDVAGLVRYAIRMGLVKVD